MFTRRGFFGLLAASAVPKPKPPVESEWAREIRTLHVAAQQLQAEMRRISDTPITVQIEHINGETVLRAMTKAAKTNGIR